MPDATDDPNVTDQPAEVPEVPDRVVLWDSLKYGWNHVERKMIVAACLMMLVMMTASAIFAASFFSHTIMERPNPVEVDVPASIETYVSGIQGPATSNGTVLVVVNLCNTTNDPVELNVVTRWLQFDAAKKKTVQVVDGAPIQGTLPPSGTCGNNTRVPIVTPLPVKVRNTPGTWRYAADIEVRSCPSSSSTVKRRDSGFGVTCNKVGPVIDNLSIYTDRFQVVDPAKVPDTGSVPNATDPSSTVNLSGD